MLSRAILLDYFKGNCRAQKKIGLEIEHLPVYIDTLKAVPYEHMKKILFSMCERYHMEGIIEGENIFGASSIQGNVTIEPGSQLEFSSIPADTIQDCYQIIKGFANHLFSELKQEGIILLHVGVHPNTDITEIRFIPRKRYEIMSNCLSGELAHYMMKATASVQCSFDYASPENFASMMKAVFSIAPVAAAMFLNSPFYMGQSTPFQGFRSRIWTQTCDPRCGFIPQVFQKNFSFEEFIDFILGVPMLFVKDHQGRYDYPPEGITFGQFMEYNQDAGIEEFRTHLSSIFTFARADKYIEIRCADSLPEDLLFSIPAFWKGLLYSPDSLDSVLQIASGWTFKDLLEAAQEVPVKGLESNLGKFSVLDIGRELIEISCRGLKEIDQKNGSGDLRYILPLQEMICEYGINNSQKINRIFEKSGNSIHSIVEAVRCR